MVQRHSVTASQRRDYRIDDGQSNDGEADVDSESALSADGNDKVDEGSVNVEFKRRMRY